MNKVYRKGRAERTGRTVLNAAETPYMGGHYRTGSSGSSTGGNSAGTGAPTGTAGEGSFYTQTDSIPAGLVWQFYNGAWHS